MFSWFKREPKVDKNKLVDKQVAEIKEAYAKDIEKKTREIKKTNTALRKYNKSDDLTLNIFLATGGDKRKS